MVSCLSMHDHEGTSASSLLCTSASSRQSLLLHRVVISPHTRSAFSAGGVIGGLESVQGSPEGIVQIAEHSLPARMTSRRELPPVFICRQQHR